MHCKLNGEEIPAEITVVRIDELDDDGSAMVAGYTRDLRPQIKAEERERTLMKRIRSVMDATPLCLNLWNTKFHNIMCNDEAVRLFELRDKQEYLDRFFELSPERQPDGQLSSEAAYAKIQLAMNTGRTQFRWMHCKLNGELIPAEITLVRLEDMEEPMVAGYTRDLREQLNRDEVRE